ncbi:hypothetical protein [Calothrix sp. NIES-2100]
MRGDRTPLALSRETLTTQWKEQIAIAKRFSSSGRHSQIDMQTRCVL